jgi:hypothetical protein
VKREEQDHIGRKEAMHQKRMLVSITFVLILLTIILGFSTKKAAASEGVAIDYLISYKGGENYAPRVTIVISNLDTSQIDLILSPMSITEDQNLWLVDTQQITATGEGGKKVPMTDGGITSVQHLGGVAQYRLLHFNTTELSTVTIQYVLNQPVMLGYLETFLLRPQDHNLVGNATLQYELPKDWLAVTVLTEEQNGLFPLGTMDSFYSDNENPIYNFVPAAFAVGAQEEIVEIKTNCGRLIYAYHAPSPSPIPVDSARALLGKAIFEYYCSVVGPLAPYNAYISGMNTSWLKPGGQPGLYPFDGQHNRTMDLLQNQPLVEFHPWEFNVCPFTTCPANQPDHSGYGFAHKFSRAWLSTGKSAMLFFSNENDWFFRGGMSYYFQEMAMTSAFGQHKVYERFQDLYNYYQTAYVQTGLDRSIVCSDSNEMNCYFLTYFKSGLWAFYLNLRILDATSGEKNIADLSRYLYTTYAGIEQPVTIKEIQDAVNTVAGTDLSEVWTRYAYGNEPLPLDYYFQDDDKDGLMNGLEIERHTDPSLADSNGNGIDDGVEYATECEQTVLDPYYCVGVIPPDAKGSQLIPSIIAMNPHPLGSPDPGGYYDSVEYSIDLRNSAIILDGISSDWPEMSPLAMDPQDTGPYDFKALYGFSDEKNLYLRIDPYGSFPSNGPAEFDINVQTDESQSSFFQIYTLAHEGNKVHLGLQVGENTQFNQQKTYVGTEIDKVFEIIIPLEFLGYPKTVTIEVVARISEGSTRPLYDSFEPVTLIIGTNTEGTEITPTATVTRPAATIIPALIPTNTLLNNLSSSSSNFDWHHYWNSYWWIVLILVGASIMIVAVFILRKKKH